GRRPIQGLLPDARGRAWRRREGGPRGVPHARPQAPPRPQPGGQGSRGALQGDQRGVRSPDRRREAQALRPFRRRLAALSRRRVHRRRAGRASRRHPRRHRSQRLRGVVLGPDRRGGGRAKPCRQYPMDDLHRQRRRRRRRVLGLLPDPLRNAGRWRSRTGGNLGPDPAPAQPRRGHRGGRRGRLRRGVPRRQAHPPAPGTRSLPHLRRGRLRAGEHLPDVRRDRNDLPYPDAGGLDPARRGDRVAGADRRSGRPRRRRRAEGRRLLADHGPPRRPVRARGRQPADGGGRAGRDGGPRRRDRGDDADRAGGADDPGRDAGGPHLPAARSGDAEAEGSEGRARRPARPRPDRRADGADGAGARAVRGAAAAATRGSL
ncbi:MAG: DnaJ-class molecular chaperone CbpA, partial [uncultured Thermomicrobiales bacterium]